MRTIPSSMILILHLQGEKKRGKGGGGIKKGETDGQSTPTHPSTHNQSEQSPQAAVPAQDAQCIYCEMALDVPVPGPRAARVGLGGTYV